MIHIVKLKIMKTNSDQIMMREETPIPNDEDAESIINSIPPSTKELNFIQAFSMIDRKRKGHLTKLDLLRFLNRLVMNAQFNVEDICNIYRRLKIEAGDDSDTLTYVQFMVAILP